MFTGLTCKSDMDEDYHRIMMLLKDQLKLYTGYPYFTRMQRIQVLKQSGLLQEKLTWSDIDSITDNLKLGRYLTFHEVEQIQDRSQPQKTAAEMLLNVVLVKQSAMSAFMKILESKSHLLNIAESINRTEISREEMESHPYITRMQRIQVLKQSGLLQRKLTWSDIDSITDNLKLGRYLTFHEVEQIQDRSQPQKTAAEMLLNVVLVKQSAVSAFMKILESKSHLLNIAERINRTEISREEMESHPYITRMQRIQVLKQSGLLQEKLTWSDIDSITDNLKLGRYLTCYEVQQIQDRSQSSRKAAEMLLNVVLVKQSAVSAFMKILESKSHLLNVAERINRTEISREEMESHPYITRMQRIQVLKQSGLLQRKLTWSDIDSITDNLKLGRYLTFHEVEQIQDRSQPQKTAAEMLLNVVLVKQSAVSAFMKILESESHLLNIAERINRTEISREEMERMQRKQVLKQSGLLQEKLTWSDIDSISDTLEVDRHLSRLKVKQIRDRSQPQKTAAEMLLNVVLVKPSAVSTFMKVLESKSHLLNIAERINRTEISREEMESHPYITRMQRMQVLKQSGLLQEKLTWNDIDSITNSLKLGRYLTCYEVEQIQDRSQPQKTAAEMLLNVVLVKQSAVSAFMKVLESESHLLNIAESINMTEISREEMERMQRTQVLKQSGLLQEELTWSDIDSISNNLEVDGHLTRHEVEQIQDRLRPQNKAAEMLLNVVLVKPSAVSAFAEILESESHLLNIAERINGTEIFAEEIKNYPFGCEWHRIRVQLVKQLDWLKEKMYKPDITEVAYNLYNDGHLVFHELQQIQVSSQSRRKAFDLLLRKVILGNPSIVPAFMHILQTKNHLLFIAERINKTDVLPKEMQDNALGCEWQRTRVQLAKQFGWLEVEMCKPHIKKVVSNDYKLVFFELMGMQSWKITSDHSFITEGIFETDISPEEMRGYRSYATMKMKVLKQYNLLKDELYWPDIISITDNLYNNGHLDYFEMSKIQDRSQPRRKVTDMLLKVVLGNPSTISGFMRILESESRLSYIAERINSTQISTEEIKRFQHQEGILLEQRKNIPRPNQNFYISFADVGTLISNLDEDVIDEIRDSLLSKFLISIHDHTKIFDCAHKEGKILQLIDLMKKGPDGIYDVFEEVFNKNNLEFVLQNLERNQMLKMKRKSLSCDVDNSPVQKRIKINHNQQGSASDTVEKMVSSLRNATVRQKLTGHVRKHMGLELKQTFKGSSGILLTFNFMEPSQKLKHPFISDPKECAEC